MLLGFFLTMITWLRRLRHLIDIVRVVGDSMLPTLKDGDWLLFIRWRLRVGSIVLADVLEEEPVIKRITEIYENKIIRICGDNRSISAEYLAFSEDIWGVGLCRLWRAN